MTVYLDVIWLLNFIIDFLLLLLTAIVLKRKVKYGRLLTSSFIGSIYVILIFFQLPESLFTPFVKIVWSNIMVLIAFGYKKLTYHIQGLLMFYLITFVTGGGLLGIHYFLQTEVEIINGIVATKSTGYGDPVTWGFIIVGFPTLLYFTKKRFEHVEIKKLNFTQIIPVEIKIDSIMLTGKGLIDSGNQLQDPISKVPVMIIDMTMFEKSFPDEFLQATKDITTIGEEYVEHPLLNRLRIIPYRGVGNHGKFLAAIKPDYVSLEYEETRLTTSKVLIGLSFTNLSGENEYEFIIHPKMVSGMKTPKTAS